MSTHYMDEAEQADRVVIMADGRVVAEGLVPEIVGGRCVVEVATRDWSAALAAVEREPRLVMLDGTLIRVLGDEPEACEQTSTGRRFQTPGSGWPRRR